MPSILSHRRAVRQGSPPPAQALYYLISQGFSLVCTLQFGWRLFAPILRAATGIEELTDAELRRAAGAEVERILRSPGPH
ncbi:hypothetical protein MAP44135_0287 [Mycobacterium avium subsp. paratuberculosis]|nr:transcriptional regulator [Mycobacterium avium subsp. paratuberculosis S5]ETB36322.1 hypothetical protein O977_01645 [Mycobacterium avium subsp. paratuberculosis 10-5975]QKU43766.1 hypothetical protein MAP44135_0287 [Mycobacterium avium subsp. paratuberculosis]